MGTHNVMQTLGERNSPDFHEENRYPATQVRRETWGWVLHPKTFASTIRLSYLFSNLFPILNLHAAVSVTAASRWPPSTGISVFFVNFSLRLLPRVQQNSPVLCRPNHSPEPNGQLSREWGPHRNCLTPWLRSKAGARICRPVQESSHALGRKGSSMALSSPWKDCRRG